jgi:hypothetical protein
MTFGSFRLNTLAAALGYTGDAVISGGTVSYYRSATATNFKLHTLTTTGSNSLVVTSPGAAGTVDLLLVGGGGAGGGTTTTIGAGGGGGGGAVVYQTAVAITPQTYTIAVGAGGTGVSGASGNAGTASTGLGYTANGGGAGTTNTAATDGGGSGTSSSTSYTSTIGTYAYKGGNSFGSASTSSRAGGGGAGAGAAGTDAASATGGNGGIGVQNNIDGQNLYYAGGGGGGGTSGGAGVTSAGVVGGGNSNGAGATSGAGFTNTIGTYGGGGGGSNRTTSTAGGGGRQGITIVRYPITSPTSIAYVAQTTTITTTLTLPTTVAGRIGLIVMSAFNTTATIPTETAPAGWTLISNTSVGTTLGARMTAYYKILAGNEAGNVTCMTGTNTTQSAFYSWTPNSTINYVQVSAINSEGTNSVPSTQTLSMTNLVGPYIGVALYASNGNVSASSSVTPTRTVGPSLGQYVKFWDSTSGAVTFTDSTVTMTDTGTNLMASYTLQLF